MHTKKETPNDFRIFLNSFTVRILNVHWKKIIKWYSFETVWKYCWNIVSLYCILSQSMTYKATEPLRSRFFLYVMLFLPLTCVFFSHFLFVCVLYFVLVLSLFFFCRNHWCCVLGSSYSFFTIHHKRYITFLYFQVFYFFNSVSFLTHGKNVLLMIFACFYCVVHHIQSQ